MGQVKSGPGTVVAPGSNTAELAGDGSPFPNRRRAMESVLDAIGGTPLIRLRKVAPPGGARLFAKVEYLNPGGSVKDRIGIRMIEAAGRAGLPRPRGTNVGPAGGNTGGGAGNPAGGEGGPRP